MSQPHANLTDATIPQPHAEIDALLIDDDADDFLDDHIAAIRELPADYRSF